MSGRAGEWVSGSDNLSEEQIAALRRGFWVGPDPLGREAGEALWPEEYPVETLSRTRQVIGGYEFDALYQQAPQQREGALIKAHEIRQVRADQVPEGIRWVRYWDLAVSGSARADWLAGAKVGMARDGRLFIGHVRHLPGPWSVAKGKIREQMLQDGPAVRQGVEVSGQQGGYYQEFKTDPSLVGLSIEPVNPRAVGDKEVRAQVWASRIQDRLVYLVDDGTWDAEAFVSESVAFPAGAHDDQVDGVSGAVQMLGGWVGKLTDVPQDEGGESLFAGLMGGEPVLFGFETEGRLW